MDTKITELLKQQYELSNLYHQQKKQKRLEKNRAEKARVKKLLLLLAENNLKNNR